MVKIKILTNNKDIYNKFLSLNFKSCSNIMFDYNNNTFKKQIGKIINSINKDGKKLDVKIINDKIIINKLTPINFNIYLTRKL